MCATPTLPSKAKGGGGGRRRRGACSLHELGCFGRTELLDINNWLEFWGWRKFQVLPLRMKPRNSISKTTDMFSFYARAPNVANFECSSTFACH